MSARWLLVGALAAEVLPVLRRLERPRWRSHTLVEGELEGQAVALLRAGVGPARAYARTHDALGRVGAARVLSFGTCGALDDALAVGALVHAADVYEGDRAFARAQSIPGVAPANLVTVDAPVHAPERRARLAGLAQVCEMEAAAVARAAGERPFYALKVVSDQAGGDPGEGLHRRDPLTKLRFQVLTWRLMEATLVPALVGLVRQTR